MLRKTFPLLLIISLLAACHDDHASPVVISQELDMESMPWVEDQSEFTVSLYDTNGNLIESEQEVQFNKEYEVVIKANKPVAVYVSKSFGFEFISKTDGEIPIGNTHKYRILKTEPGYNQLVYEIYPLYYLEGKLTRERPQLFVFPKKLTINP